MKITQIKTIVNRNAEEFDSAVNAFLELVEDDLLSIIFERNDRQYIAHIIYHDYTK